MGRGEEIQYYRFRLRSLIEEHRKVRRPNGCIRGGKQRFQSMKAEIQTKLDATRVEMSLARSSVQNKAWKVSMRCSSSGLEKSDCKCRSCVKLRDDFENVKSHHLILEELSQLLNAIISCIQMIIDELPWMVDLKLLNSFTCQWKRNYKIHHNPTPILRQCKIIFSKEEVIVRMIRAKDKWQHFVKIWPWSCTGTGKRNIWIVVLSRNIERENCRHCLYQEYFNCNFRLRRPALRHHADSKKAQIFLNP